MKRYIITLFFGIVIGGLATEGLHRIPEPESIEFVKVVSIYDGDTFFCDLPNTRPIFGKRIGIRIRGVDTPEMHDEREDVREKARQAKMFVVEKLRSAQTVELRNLERGKYFRLVADVYVDGANLGQLLLSEGLAREYDGKSKRSW